MIQYLWKINIVLVALFAGAVLLIRAQPYDDHDLKEFLASLDECLAPCFMGIRPGVTSVEDAVAILNDHPWVSAVSEPQITSEGNGNQFWTWRENQPFLNSQRFSNWIYAEGRRVESINVQTSIPFVFIWWAYGKPDYINVARRGDDRLLYLFDYAAPQVSVVVEVPGCKPVGALMEPVTLHFQNRLNRIFASSAKAALSDFRNVDICAHS